MTDMERLIDAVEAGDVGWNAIASMCEAAGIELPQSQFAASAYTGSLDAALALHNALLPGCDWGVWNGGAMVSDASAEDHFGEASNPARAWLLAILLAKAAQE